jgi:hypothetical protein
MMTYNRKVEHQGKEDREVEKIVQSLTIEGEDPMSRKAH